jgi:hypothetical protein
MFGIPDEKVTRVLLDDREWYGCVPGSFTLFRDEDSLLVFKFVLSFNDPQVHREVSGPQANIMALGSG